MSDLDRLIRFSVVAEELSFSAAARRLNVDQPWLSRQIQQLEAQLSFPLFVRSTRKVTLTEKGEELFKHAYALTKAANDCRNASREMMRSHSQKLTIGVNPYTYWLPERKEIIAFFTARHPRVSVEIVSGYTPQLLSMLRGKLIDVALVVEPHDAEELETLTIHSSPLTLLVPPEDPLAQRESVALSDLAGRPLPVTDPELNPQLSDHLYGPFFRAGAIPRIVPEGTNAMPFYAASERLAVAMVGWPHVGRGELRDFIQIPIVSPLQRCQYSLVRCKGSSRGMVNFFWEAANRVTEARTSSRPELAPSRPECERTADPEAAILEPAAHLA